MNQLTLAAAGGRKTQSIVDQCVCLQPGRRALVVTYTLANQRELIGRLANHRPLETTVDVRGWFSFLMGSWVRPYLPMVFPGRRLRGFNFDGEPSRFAVGQSRFLDQDGRAYKRHLARLAVEISQKSGGAVLARLGRIYDEVYVDEVQDLNGYDLEVLLALLRSSIGVHLVGDVRQALLHTNVKDPKNKQYKGPGIRHWFALQERAQRLTIRHVNRTWRCNQAIANFADSIFGSDWGFPATESMNTGVTGHDGVFAVAKHNVEAYVREYRPLCLRHSSAIAADLSLPFVTIGDCKGRGVQRVLIAPTVGMVKFLTKEAPLGEVAACALYVAVTRAQASVAFVLDRPETVELPEWAPGPYV